MGEGARIHVTVVSSPRAREVLEQVLDLPSGATLQDAIAACGLPGGPGECAMGIWGRQVAADHVLRNGDRVEVYRPLLADPKVARRERFRKQGVKTPGLFAQRRAGSKQGY